MFQNIYFANIVYCFLRNKSVNSIMFYKPDIIIKRGFKYFLKIFCRKSNMIDFRALFLVNCGVAVVVYSLIIAVAE